MASSSSFTAAFISSAFAACFAEVCTIPLDTAKVRLQLQKKTPPSAAPATGATVAGRAPGGGTLATIMCIAREEGVAALWKGIIPGLHRQFLYGGLRIGLYEPVKAFFAGGTVVGHGSLLHNILAALTTGVIAIIVANPTDLVKVRLQADGKANTVKRNYSGALNAYATIIRQEGIGALWTGLGPNVARNAIINAAELASYDQLKQMFLKLPGFTDNVFTHILAGLGAGFFAVSIGSPVDVVKSRMMGDSTYRSTLDCFAKTLKNDILHRGLKNSDMAVVATSGPSCRQAAADTLLCSVHCNLDPAGVTSSSGTEPPFQHTSPLAAAPCSSFPCPGCAAIGKGVVIRSILCRHRLQQLVATSASICCCPPLSQVSSC